MITIKDRKVVHETVNKTLTAQNGSLDNWQIVRNGKHHSIFLKVIKGRMQFRMGSQKGDLVGSYAVQNLDDVELMFKKFTSEFWFWKWD